MVGVLPTLGLAVGILGIFLTYFLYKHGKKPTATEIASELRDSLHSTTNERTIRTNRHLVNVLDVKVTESSNWLDEYDDANKQLAYVLLKGLFVGKAEIIAQFEIPETPPSIEDIRSHPYYGEEVHSTNADSGTGGYEVSLTGQTLILEVNLFADSVREGVVAVIMTHIIVSQIIDDILSGKIEMKDQIPSFEEYMNQINRENIDNPVMPIEELSKADFVFPD